MRLTDYDSNDVNKPMYSSFTADRVFKLEPRSVNALNGKKRVKGVKTGVTDLVEDYKDKRVFNTGGD